MRQLLPQACGFAVAVLLVGFVAEAQAVGPRGLLLQRRGNSRFTIPAPPSPVDSSPTIDTLNKALKALGSTDRDYDGHRETAIEHIASAIHHLETPNAKGKSNAAIQKAAAGKPAQANKTATTPQAASDESLRKAKAILFVAHHDLTQHTATRGHIRADADVRTAITEIVNALKPSTTPPAAKAATAPAAAASASAIRSPTTTSITPRKAAK